MAKAKGRAPGRGNTRGKAAQTLGAAVIERRGRGAGEWEVFRVWAGDVPSEADLVWACKELAERLTGDGFRYRYATLTFDDDGRKCVIY